MQITVKVHINCYLSTIKKGGFIWEEQDVAAEAPVAAALAAREGSGRIREADLATEAHSAAHLTAAVHHLTAAIHHITAAIHHIITAITVLVRGSLSMGRAVCSAIRRAPHIRREIQPLKSLRGSS